jgi:outer membrane protein TolC
LQIAATAWQIRAGVRSALLDLAAAQRRQAVLENQIELQRQIIVSLEQQIQAGALAGVEATPYRIALQKTQLDVADAQRDAADARAHLAESIGVPVRALDAAPLKVDFPFSSVATNLTSDQVRHEALLGRADILAALADYAAAEATLQLEISKQYPDVHLSPSYQWNQGDNTWGLGISAELPVFDKNQGPIAEAVARRAASAARFTALQAKVLGDIDSAVEGFRAGEKNLALIADLAVTQVKSRDAVAAQVNAGAAAPLDLLNARLELAVAEQGQLDARIKQQQALAALEDAVQRPIRTITPAIIENSPLKENKP